MMDRQNLIQVLAQRLPGELARDAVEEFLQLRQDVATNTLGRTAAGKFVETLVQILQYLETGKHEPSPKVDDYLRKLESRPGLADDGIRLCAARIGRAMYALRNKRNIAHKGNVDPNAYDLAFLFHAAQWVMAELLRVTCGMAMAEAGRLVAQVQAPVAPMVEDFGTRRLVLEAVSVREELLVLLHSHYPSQVATAAVLASLDRRSEKTVRNALRALWRARLVHENGKGGYMLTRTGFTEATAVLEQCVSKAG
jgi:hypothetical protein